MAKRYCGDVTIESYFYPTAGKFRVRVSCPKGYLIEMVEHQGTVGLPATADSVAYLALKQAVDRTDTSSLADPKVVTKAQALADAAALGLRDGQYQIARSRREAQAA